jgi:hypothetical protein
MLDLFVNGLLQRREQSGELLFFPLKLLTA